jgi:hypothetical protein
MVLSTMNKKLRCRNVLYKLKCVLFLLGLEGGNCYDDDQLARPVKRFIAEYVRKQVCTNIHNYLSLNQMLAYMYFF